MEAFLTALGVVAVSEIGDRTQLLAFVLATRFRRPVPILFGIFLATLANHTLAGLAGYWVRGFLTPEIFRWVLGTSFIVMAAWSLVPDKIDEEAPERASGGQDAFITTLVAFFLAEMGDKTQIATVALAARFSFLPAVIAGTTLGMMVANIPAVFGGHAAGSRINLRYVRIAATVIFLVQGIMVLAG